MTSKAVSGERLHDRVTRTLACAVLSGELPEGYVTSELALCGRLDVSRTILRESIKVLVSKGLLEVRPRVGVTVRNRSEWYLFDPDVLAWQSEQFVDGQFIRTLCEVRLIVETSAAALAATRATRDQRDRIAKCFQSMEAKVANKQAYDDADIAFHGAIFEACHNDLLRQLSTTIRQALQLQDRSGSESRSDVQESLELHRHLARTIVQGDATLARNAMESIIFHAARSFYRMHETNGAKDWDLFGFGDYATLSEIRTMLKKVIAVLDHTQAGGDARNSGSADLERSAG
jgi:DNA-binding FadR family transcriptional regulator